jgi:class 3 adenylate cyclase
MTVRSASRRSPTVIYRGAFVADKEAFWSHNSLHDDDQDDMSEQQVPLGLHTSGLTSLHEDKEISFDDGEEVLESGNNSTHTHVIGDDKVEAPREKYDVCYEFPLEHDISFPMLTVGAESVRRRLLASVDRLSAHVPAVVLHRLLDEAQAQTSYCSFGFDGSYDDGKEEVDDDSYDCSSKSTISEISDIDDTLAAYMKKSQPPPVVAATTKKKKIVARLLIGGSFENKIPDFRQSETGSRARSICSGIFPLSESGVVSTGSSLCGLRSLASGVIPPHVEAGVDCYNEMPYQYERTPSPLTCAPHTPYLMSFLSKQVLSLNRSHRRASLKRRLFGEGEGALLISAEAQKYLDLSLKAIGLRDQSPPVSATTPTLETKNVVDPFPYDSDDERLVTERLFTGRHHVGVGNGSNVMYPEDIATPLKENVGATKKVVRTIDGAPYNGGLPFVARRQSAILVIGISGFTKMSTVLALESLADAIRDSSFDLIVDDIKAYGGDILEFTGDAILVEWSTLRSNPVPVDATHSFVPSSLGECALAAATCAAKLVSVHSNVHCGLGVGEIVGIHLGASRSIRKHIVLGDPLDQVSEASRSAKLGEVLSSPDAFEVLSTVCDFNPGVKRTLIDRPQVIAYGKETFWGNIQAELKLTETIGEDNLKKLIRKLPLKALQRYRELVTLYTHPVVVADDETTFEDRAAKGGVQERVGETSEIRSVYTFCIALILPVRVSGDAESDRQLFVLLNDVMNLTTSELFKCGGHLRQFIVDDKGVVIIATLGLRGSADQRKTAEVALPAAISVQNALKAELGIQSKIGVSVGEAYCGVVGGWDCESTP